MRKAFSLIELLVTIAVALLIIGGAVYFFSKALTNNIGTLSFSRGSVSVFQAVKVIDSDLLKAGYGINDTSVYPPVSWDNVNRILIIRYVDYEKPGCENATFSSSSTCSYVVQYKLIDGNLERKVNGSLFIPMFDSGVVEVSDFNVSFNSTSHVVNYKLEGTLNGKYFSIGDIVICRNWR
ncbi:prepilin peptidase dependent protein B [Desulfurobacterium pacificum]|uniref:Prepilin peptidase dependent protein B n=1 Tax=Desulfurobacterium pacificum TaxID=240166 RepID=A0ABY1NNH3_9BACT|nr:prepilin-type N-terminal cleavage/methylation domain-containing protein [Desulfurobacterium pacificum]SMP14238.1 prepilin peptidase dependent protein B [Desulfurobacterium pacificum]